MIGFLEAHGAMKDSWDSSHAVEMHFGLGNAKGLAGNRQGISSPDIVQLSWSLCEDRLFECIDHNHLDGDALVDEFIAIHGFEIGSVGSSTLLGDLH